MSFVNTTFQLLKKGPFWFYACAFALVVMVTQHYTIGLVMDRNKDLKNKMRVDSLNAEARNSTTRKIADSYMREAVQEKLRADSLDKKLKLKPMVKQKIVARIDSMSGKGRLQKALISDVGRAASFSIDNDLMFGQVSVLMPFDTSIAPSMRYGFGFRPIPLAMALGCKDGKSLVAITPPKGIKLELESMRQDPNICGSPAASIRVFNKSHRKLYFGLGAVVGAWLGYEYAK